MKIWLVNAYERIPWPGSGERALRMGLIAREFVARGHEVTRFVSNYDHFEKRYRGDPEDDRQKEALGYRVLWLDSVAYRSNVSVARIRGSWKMARHFRRLAVGLPKPDVILASYPVPELAAAAVDFGRKAGVPCFIDIRDWWPDIFETAIPKAARPFGRLLLAPLQRTARHACGKATGILGITDPFVEWGLRKGRRERSDLDRAFPFGYSEFRPDDEDLAMAERFWREAGLEPGQHRIVVFLGTLSRTLDVPTILKAARILVKDRPDLRFVLAGRGDFQPRFKEESRDVPELIFPGWIKLPEIWALLRMSCIALNAMPDRPDFLATINNKATEYLSAGLPVVVSPDRGVVHDLVTRHRCGIGYQAGNAADLADKLAALLDDDERSREMGRNARELFLEKFRADQVYGAMCEHLCLAGR